MKNSFFGKRWSNVLAIITLVLCGVSIAAAQGATPVPKVTGPIPVTAEWYPYLAANNLLEPMDLSKAGYTEEEFFVNGTANVYDWAANGDLSVVTSNAPYTTRILVRRPKDSARFSGNVIVELLHAPFGQDFSPVWGWSYDYYLEHGDAWVGISSFPAAIKSLQKFNPARYASLGYPNPTPYAPCPLVANAVPRGGDNAPNNDPDTEEGLRWDAISQIGALLKSDVPGRPLAGFKVEYLLQTSQDPIQLTYISAFAKRAKLANGKPVYDGYLVKGGVRPARISRCAAAPGENDARNEIKNIGVPMIHVQMQGDFPGAFAARRPDSDESADRFRTYEFAGVSHFDSAPYRHALADFKTMAASGNKLTEIDVPPGLEVYGAFANPFKLAGVERCDPDLAQTDQPIASDLFHGAFMNLEAWVRGTPPPRGARLEPKDATTTQAAVAVDQNGNATGGVRTPYVDVPIATYHMNHKGPGLCRVFGWAEPFDWAKLDALYGSQKNYAAKFSDAVDRAAKDRWLTPSDAQKLKSEVSNVPPMARAPREDRATAGSGQ